MCTEVSLLKSDLLSNCVVCSGSLCTKKPKARRDSTHQRIILDLLFGIDTGHLVALGRQTEERF